MGIVIGFIRTIYRIAAVALVLWLLLIVSGDPSGAMKALEGRLDQTGSMVRHWLSIPG
jgi:hypothetical protein